MIKDSNDKVQEFLDQGKMEKFQKRMNTGNFTTRS